MTDLGESSVRPGDDRLRERGQDLIMRFLALIRVGRSYQVENQVFHQQLRTLLETLQPIFTETHEAVLISLDSDLYLNGARLPARATNLRFHQALMKEMERRCIAGLRILEGVDEAELERFFRSFLQPDVYNGPALLEACVAQNTTHIMPVLHAFTESGDDADPFDPASFARWSREDQTAGFGAPGGGSGHGGGDGNAGGDNGSGGGEASRTGPTGPRPVARKSYSLAMLGARSLITTTALDGGIQLRLAKRVVQPLIDGALAGEPVVLGLSSLSHHDEYTYAHSVNVCMVAVTLGHVLGLDRRALADLGVAALLHDIGKVAVYDRIRHPLEALDAEERRLAESHPLEGAKLIAHSTTLNSSTLRCMQVALEHHAGRMPRPAAAAAGGYPALPQGWCTSRLSEIVAIADCFVSLQMHRSQRGRSVTPYEALSMVLGPYAGDFDPVLQWALVRTVGFYPPGQLVELSDGRTAVVLAPNREDPGRPHVRVILDECGVPFSAVEGRELHPLPPTLGVKRALRGTEYSELPLAA